MKLSAGTRRIVVALAVAIFVAAAFLLPFGAQNVAYAGTYGGQDYSELWYSDTLDIATAKAVIEMFGLPVLVPNWVDHSTFVMSLLNFVMN